MPPGRHKIPLDPQKIRDLAEIHCTMEEIGHVVGCSPDTLERRFMDVIKEGRDTGRASLRRMQYAKAKEGNPTMLIWLGKQLLGQSDQVSQEISGPKGAAIEFIINDKMGLKPGEADVVDAGPDKTKSEG